MKSFLVTQQLYLLHNGIRNQIIASKWEVTDILEIQTGQTNV